jgi:hypothetical protein
MSRFVALTSVLALVLVGLTLSARHQAIAQDATPVATESHPIIGTWVWDNDPANPRADVTYGIFHADGSYAETSTFNGTALGAWEATGERSVDVIETFVDIDESPALAPGTAMFLISLQVDSRGETFIGTGAVQVRSPAGEVTFEASDLLFTGTRVKVAPLPDFGTWMAGTPVAGTPIPLRLRADTH